MTIFGYIELSKQIIQISSVTIYFKRKTKPKPTATGTFKISDVAHVILILLVDSTRLKSYGLHQETLRPPYNNPALSNLHLGCVKKKKKSKVTSTASLLVTRTWFPDKDFKNNFKWKKTVAFCADAKETISHLQRPIPLPCSREAES